MEYYIKSVTPIIESNYEKFTPLEKNIADFFIKNQELVDFGKGNRRTIVCVRSFSFQICKKMWL